MFVDTCFAEISAVNREFISKKYCTHTGSTTDGQTNIHISCGLLEDERAGGPSDRSCRPPSFFLGLPRISGTTRDRSSRSRTRGNYGNQVVEIVAQPWTGEARAFQVTSVKAKDSTRSRYRYTLISL